MRDLKLLKVPIILSFKPDRTKYFSSTGQEWCCEQDQIIYRQHKGTFSPSCRLGGGGSSSPLPAHLRKCQSTGTKLHLEEPRDSHELARRRPARAGLNLVSEPWVQKPKASSSRSPGAPQSCCGSNLRRTRVCQPASPVARGWRRLRSVRLNPQLPLREMCV